jgi:hypothetical protein
LGKWLCLPRAVFPQAQFLFLTDGACGNTPRGHLFFRWDERTTRWRNPITQFQNGPEVFNVEGAGEGIGSYSDEHYRTWPEPWSAAETTDNVYLRSLSPVEELAAFLSTRGECLQDNGRTAEAIQAYQWVCGLLPQSKRYRSRLVSLVRLTHRTLDELNEMIAFSRAAREQHAQKLLPGIGSNLVCPAIPPHGDYCQCLHCRQARDRAHAAARTCRGILGAALVSVVN